MRDHWTCNLRDDGVGWGGINVPWTCNLRDAWSLNLQLTCCVIIELATKGMVAFALSSCFILCVGFCLAKQFAKPLQPDQGVGANHGMRHMSTCSGAERGKLLLRVSHWLQMKYTKHCKIQYKKVIWSTKLQREGTCTWAMYQNYWKGSRNYYVRIATDDENHKGNYPRVTK